MHSMDDRARTKEQQRFEKGVGHHVEDGGHISPRTNG